MATPNDSGNTVASEKGIFNAISDGGSKIKRFLKRNSDLAKHLWFAYR